MGGLGLVGVVVFVYPLAYLLVSNLVLRPLPW